MVRRKRSVLWTIEDLAERVANATSFSEILVGLGLRKEGGNTRTLKTVLREREIDFSHIREGRGSNVGNNRGGGGKPTPLEEILVEGSSFSRTHLKRKLIAAGLLIERCDLCNCGTLWNERPLRLVLDHINGIFNDNRIENLRLLCPNCNSQQETFAGRRPTYIRG